MFTAMRVSRISPTDDIWDYYRRLYMRMRRDHYLVSRYERKESYL